MQGPLTHPEIYNGGLLAHPKGILLYGPPGTGKTMVAKVMWIVHAALLLLILWHNSSCRSNLHLASYLCLLANDRLALSQSHVTLMHSILYLLKTTLLFIDCMFDTIMSESDLFGVAHRPLPSSAKPSSWWCSPAQFRASGTVKPTRPLLASSSWLADCLRASQPASSS